MRDLIKEGRENIEAVKKVGMYVDGVISQEAWNHIQWVDANLLALLDQLEKKDKWIKEIKTVKDFDLDRWLDWDEEVKEITAGLSEQLEQKDEEIERSHELHLERTRLTHKVITERDELKARNEKLEQYIQHKAGCSALLIPPYKDCDCGFNQLNEVKSE